MDKVQILTNCRACGGQAYVPTNEVMSTADGRRYIRHLPCNICQGSGMEERWGSFQEFAGMLAQVTVERDA